MGRTVSWAVLLAVCASAFGQSSLFVKDVSSTNPRQFDLPDIRKVTFYRSSSGTASYLDVTETRGGGGTRLGIIEKVFFGHKPVSVSRPRGFSAGMQPNRWLLQASAVSGQLRITMRGQAPGHTRIRLVDARGRCVSVLYDGPVYEGTFVKQAGWASLGIGAGLYAVVVQTDNGACRTCNVLLVR